MGIEKLIGKLPELTEGEIFAREQEYARQRAARPAKRAALRAANHHPWPIALKEDDKTRLMSNVNRVTAWTVEQINNKLDQDVAAIRAEDAEKRKASRGN